MGARLGLSFGDVVVCDDFVPRDLQRRITALTQGPIWQYGWRSNSRRDRFCFWHAHFAGGDGKARVGCEDELLAKPELLPIHELWQILKAGPLKGHEPVRMYANGHTYGVEGYVHTDNDDTENYFTTVYYAHPVWHENWVGETVFYTRDRKDIIRSVFPRPGRMVSFHGAIPHAAHGPSRDCTELRTCVVIKTQKVSEDVSA